MKKSQIKSKLNQDFCHAVKHEAIKTNMLERLCDNKKYDIIPGDDNDLDIPDA